MKTVELYPLCNMKVLLCLLLLQTYLSCWLCLHLQYTKSCNLRFPYFSPIWKWKLVGERKGLVFCVHSTRHEVKTDIFHGNDNKCFNNSQCDNIFQKCLICNIICYVMYKTLLCLLFVFCFNFWLWVPRCLAVLIDIKNIARMTRRRKYYFNETGL